MANKKPRRKAPAKKSPTRAKKKAPAKKAAPKKRAAPAKSAAKSTTKKRSPSKKAAPRKRAAKRPPPSAYERRDANARAAGYESYWDQRQSRVRAREALQKIGEKQYDAQDPRTIRMVDELGTLGRGESARELYYKTKRILETYEPAPTDRQIWTLIRIFYKPRGRR